MNRLAIRNRARDLLDDTATPYLWSDAELNYNIDEAQREAAIRADLIKDDSLTIALNAAQARYEFDPGCKILYVDHVRLNSQSDFTLMQTSFEKLSRETATVGWGTGLPCWYALDGVEDTSFRSITVFPTPTADQIPDTLLLSVKRLPFALGSDSSPLEIDENWHADLIEWVLALAYRKHNTDTDSREKAQWHESNFERAFGPRLPIDSIRRRQTLVPDVILVA